MYSAYGRIGGTQGALETLIHGVGLIVAFRSNDRGDGDEQGLHQEEAPDAEKDAVTVKRSRNRRDYGEGAQTEI